MNSSDTQGSSIFIVYWKTNLLGCMMPVKRSCMKHYIMYQQNVKQNIPTYFGTSTVKCFRAEKQGVC